MRFQITLLAIALSALSASTANAKLPPVSDEAKAKADEAAAKTAWSDKVANYKLCQSMDRVAATYLDRARAAGHSVQPVATPPCTDPGPFSYTPAEPKPIEASGAHSPPQTASTPPSTTQPAAGTKP
ncbi:hypothetical protein B2J86_07490 [Acidovorax sp. SRB_14]|uniref:hypothetical protein n=1 Tax=Acidovorax sp. SRB_14 TaxID=1962699 RepID=UPI00146EB3D5|nr:hypothetical protein [Acidovorax sp. SRB_14]NMM80775.1 hypothetical protein [Acidovorax sp. SRB_14]NMM85747.1 hypothetical protein [Rhodococcus sp. SRB_17]